ncbi:MAG TPA: response regulator [Bacteroidales bacterium]|jgi:CheY-like chemotaxis protein|nr:response regulator [Bacteroidales bacterium]
MNKKIVVIDDDAQFRMMMVEMLERKGYEVYAAADGEEGIQLWESLSPDLVITDIIMPNKEGIETILELKRKNKAVKIIAISGGGRTNAQDNLRSAKLLGASLTLAKPFESAELMAAVVKLIGSETT